MDAHASRARRPSAWPRILLLGVTLPLLCLATLVTHVPAARASGIPPVTATPWAITPGSSVTIQVSQPTGVPAFNYRLFATLQEISPGQCPSAQAIPGTGTLTIAPPYDYTKTTFTWPDQLGLGSWWLCAIATDTNAVFSTSQQPLVVEATIPPPTATPLPSIVTMEGPTRTVSAGATLTFNITNWDPTQQLADAIVVADEGANPGKLSGPTLVVHTIALDPPSTLVASVTLSESLSPGLYHLLFRGTQTDYIATPSFNVVAAIPTTTASALLPTSAHTIVTGLTTSHDARPPMVLFIVVGLLLLAATTVTVTAIRRRRA